MANAPRNGVDLQETRRATAVTEPSRWRQVGWVFRDGEILAIEGSGRRTRRREWLG